MLNIGLSILKEQKNVVALLLQVSLPPLFVKVGLATLVPQTTYVGLGDGIEAEWVLKQIVHVA